MPTRNISIEAQGQDRWRIRTVRRLRGASATGEVVVRRSEGQGSDDLPHKALAGSRAWLSLGEARLAADDTQGAVKAARKGLEELGDGYRSANMEDDTSLTLLLAEDEIKQGESEVGATRLLNTLKERIGLYEKLHEATIAGG